MSEWRGSGGTGRFLHTDKKKGGSEPKASDGHEAAP
jgi:hypothetical protein